jgi:hypothetical protein
MFNLITERVGKIIKTGEIKVGTTQSLSLEISGFLGNSAMPVSVTRGKTRSRFTSNNREKVDTYT